MPTPLPAPPPPQHPAPQGYYPGPSRPPPPVPVSFIPPPPAQPHQPPPQPHPSHGHRRIASGSSSGEKSLGGDAKLRQVSLPRECLPRFLAIAAPNTARNLETCGLLLGRERSQPPGDGSNASEGKDKGFLVTTMLIPKQRATSDTCNMEGEEGVLAFTEGRGLITLGWIHTHPTQSCFMSSVDLHTHSGFQCMLRESFAVVCAPKSTPNFGIFRLTDPPGLDIVLKCDAKDAFHPHPDRPIYT
ncbi:hypothetical protein H0H87_000332, partial [Tephrocybe sp. NHM501043]